MTIHVSRQRLRIARNGDLLTARFSLDALTDQITLRIGRETTAGSHLFGAASRLSTRLIVRADAQDFICEGQTTGGIRLGELGEDIAEYRLSYLLPRGFLAGTDRQRRIGETVSTFDVLLELLLDGDRIDTEYLVESTESPAPTAERHSSVAFDAATDAVEASGDGVLSLSHTASGTDRAVFMAATSSINAVTSSSFTYGGNSANELWDIRGSFQNNAGYELAGDSNVPTGSQTATSTLSGSPGTRHIIAVLSLEGVDPTTPVGTAQTRTGINQTSSSLTVTDLDGDGLICDVLNCGHGSDPAQSVGADQTERTTELDTTSGNQRTATSTQLSSVDGVMSWTMTGSGGGNAHGAIEFKPAAAGGGGATLVAPIAQNFRNMGYG